MKKLFIATPMYGGQCVGQYACAMTQLAYDFAYNNLPLMWRFEYRNSVLPHGRNILVNQFLESDFDYLLFIDSDIEFTSKDIFTLLDWAEKRQDIKILAGLYPKKSFPLIYPINWIDGKPLINSNQPVKVKSMATGFTLIKKEVFIAFQEKYPEKMGYDPDLKKDIFVFFDFNLQDGQYLGEDVYFSYLCQKININTWLIPSIKLKHHGNYSFGS